MESNSQIIKFVGILTIVVAVLLTGLREATKDIAERNEEIFNKRAILAAVVNKMGDRSIKDYSEEEILGIFDKQVQQVTLMADGSKVEGILAEDVDMAQEKKKPEADRKFPLFIFQQGGEQYYILAVRGNGLWDEIWGYIALENDVNTIAGTSFDHKGETPGLGAEIKDNANFSKNFVGDQIYNAQGEFVSVLVKKGGADKDDPHAVDGISGATVTANGVTEMLDRGIQYYEPYLKTIKK